MSLVGTGSPTSKTLKKRCSSASRRISRSGLIRELNETRANRRRAGKDRQRDYRWLWNELRSLFRPCRAPAIAPIRAHLTKRKLKHCKGSVILVKRRAQCHAVGQTECP